MAHRLERYESHALCDDYRDDPSAGYGKRSTVSVKGHWRSARIHSDRRIDLLARPFEREIERGFKFEPSICERNSRLKARAPNRLKRNRKSANPTSGREHAKNSRAENR